MSDTVKWSFSTDRCVRRCQRQYFLQHVAAWHNAKDPIRREAYIAKQLKTVSLWQGNVIHRGIELFVVPALQEQREVDWQQAVDETQEMAKRQFEFSAARRYREDKMTKSKAGDDYCALVDHETEEGVSSDSYGQVLANIEASFCNLSEMEELLDELRGRPRYWPELIVRLTYDVARIEAWLDLLFFRGHGQPTIVDWKVSESLGGSDAALQTALYAWALCRHPSWHVTRAEDCQLLEVQLLKKTVVRHRATEEVFDRLEGRIYRSVDAIRSLRLGRKYDIADLEDYDFAANPNSCAMCPQRVLCQKLAGSGHASDTEASVETNTLREESHAATYTKLF